MSQIPTDDIQARLYKLRKRESEQLKIVSELHDMGSSGDVDAQLSQIEHDGEKMYGSETPIAKL